MRVAAMYDAEFIALVICAPRSYIKKRLRVGFLIRKRSVSARYLETDIL